MGTGVTPPQSRESEEYLLSVCLQTPEAIDLACDYVGKDDFYYPSNGAVFEAMVAMRLAGEAVDVGTLTAKGMSREFLHHLNDLPSLISHTADYAKAVAGLSLRRRIIRAGQRMIEKAAEEADAEAVLDASEGFLLAARGRGSSDGPVPLRELLREAEARVDDAKSGHGRYGLRTHMPKLNELIVGLSPGTFNILAARPGEGKTALALEIARHAALEHRVVFFSVEMTRHELVDRLLAQTSHVPLLSLRTGKVTEQEVEKLRDAVATLGGSHMVLDDGAATMFEVQRRVRRLAAHGPLDLVVVDYIQLLKMGRGRFSEDNRQNEVAGISRQMKLMAREFNVPVLSLSQLNRPERKYNATEGTKNPRPTLSSLRESGALEQDADQVWFLYREHPESPETELVVAKNRSGPTGKVLLHFVPHLTSFIEV